MALAPAPPPAKLGRPSRPQPERRLEIPQNSWAEQTFAPAALLVSGIVESSPADLGWLAWLDRSEPLVIRKDASSPVEPSVIAEFPEPPAEPIVIGDGTPLTEWALWCRARGIRSCVVVPVVARARVIGTMGLASSTGGALGRHDARQLEVDSPLAVHARIYEARLAGQRRLFAEVSRSLENALALDRAIRQPPSYQEIARAVGDSLDASYCLIAIGDSQGALSIRAQAGHRPPGRIGVVRLPLSRLRGCAQALRERHAVVLNFSQHDPAIAAERRALFSSTTQVGAILPFFAGPRTQGLLIVGEERRSRFQPLSPERIAILELMAGRIAHIVRISRRLEYQRLAERRRQHQITIERQRLAGEVHDGVVQALGTLLGQVRGAMAEGAAGLDELQVLERAACRAVDGARALAYGIRHLERGIGALEEARSYAETMLRAAHCRLSWTEERNDLKIASRVLREIAHAIKESINNVVQQAKATSVRVRVEFPDGRIRVTIHDDGVGPSLLKAGPAGDQRGPVGSSERLARFGGTLDVRSAPNGGGTLVLIEARRR